MKLLVIRLSLLLSVRLYQLRLLASRMIIARPQRVSKNMMTLTENIVHIIRSMYIEYRAP